jgi:hypothetical protein
MRGERNEQMEIPTQVPNLKKKSKAPISCSGRRGNTKNSYHCVRTEPNQGELVTSLLQRTQTIYFHNFLYILSTNEKFLCNTFLYIHQRQVVR